MLEVIGPRPQQQVLKFCDEEWFPDTMKTVGEDSVSGKAWCVLAAPPLRATTLWSGAVLAQTISGAGRGKVSSEPLKSLEEGMASKSSCGALCQGQWRGVLPLASSPFWLSST